MIPVHRTKKKVKRVDQMELLEMTNPVKKRSKNPSCKN
jgi:hypothetical protein